MSFCANSHEAYFILHHLREHSTSTGIKRTLTPSFGSSLISSRAPCTPSRIFPIAVAYFRPCSPSNTTPECLMMLAGWPRDIRRYPRTDRLPDRRECVCSSSGGGGVALDVDSGAVCERENRDPAVDEGSAALSAYAVEFQLCTSSRVNLGEMLYHID